MTRQMLLTSVATREVSATVNCRGRGATRHATRERTVMCLSVVRYTTAQIGHVSVLLFTSLSSGKRLAMATVVFFFVFVSFPFSHHVPHKPPPTPICNSCLTFSSPSIQLCFNAALPSNSLSSPPRPPPPPSGHLISVSHHPFQPTSHHVLLKTFLHANLHSQYLYSSLICSFHPHDSSQLNVFGNLHQL